MRLNALFGIFASFALVLLPTSQSVFANGGEVSGGADSFEVAPAFFLSTDSSRKISLCYEVAPNFGAKGGDVESILRWAFAKWGDYIQKRDLTYAIWTGDVHIVSALGDVREGCKGGEDLSVYL